MAKQLDDNEVLQHLDAAGALYERYLEVARIAVIPSQDDQAQWSADLPPRTDLPLTLQLAAVPSTPHHQAVVPDSPPSAAREAILWVKQASGLSDQKLAEIFAVTRQTVASWAKDNVELKPSHLQRLLGTTEIMRRAEGRSGDLKGWLYTPRGEDGRTPASLLAAGELGMARMLAMTNPAPGGRLPAEWARGPVATRFAHLVEPRQAPLKPEPPTTPSADLED